MAAPRNRRHIIVPNAPAVEKYTPHGGGGPTATPGAPPVGRPSHAALLNTSIESAVDEAAVRRAATGFEVSSAKPGVYRAAGNYAIAAAASHIRAGRAEVMLAGGADPFSLTAFAGFNRLYACASERVQPFDKERQGMMVSEGCGMLVLESLQRARARRAPVIAEVVGVGSSCDAHHMMQPAPAGRGILSATYRALTDAGLAPNDIDYFCAHGTGTPPNDRIEAAALREVFGAHTDTLPVSSIKGNLGHCMGAASALEAVATALCIKHGVVPPTLHYEQADPECDVDVVARSPREVPIEFAMSNAYGFGGTNMSLVLGACAS